MHKGQMNLQDVILNQVRRQGIGVTIYLATGVQLKGTIRAFDSFTILLEGAGRGLQMIYKHAITSVVPMGPVSLTVPESPEDDEGA